MTLIKLTYRSGYYIQTENLNINYFLETAKQDGWHKSNENLYSTLPDRDELLEQVKKAKRI